MQRFVLEKYAKKGWLKYGMKNFGTMERLWAARRIYADYIRCKERSVGVVDPLKPKVDGGKFDYGLKGNLDAKDAFLKAYGSLSAPSQRIIDTFVFGDEVSYKKTLDKKMLNLLKRQLCAALDCLILHYLAKDTQEEENEQYYR